MSGLSSRRWSKHKPTQRLDRMRRTQRLPDRYQSGSHRSDPARNDSGLSATTLAHPPKPPTLLTPQLACSPDTDPEILWAIARQAPELRKWLVANPNANAELLEFVAQASGPGIGQALEILFESMDEPSTT